MGSTLTNGIYLPAEGERNCYTGLAANWSALDSLIGGYNAHIGNTTIHVTAEDKQAWNGHVADLVKHVTAEDKAKWDAVTSKANDSDVVHKSGDETVIGSKRFGVVQNFTGYPTIRLYGLTDDINVLPSAHEQRDIRFTDKNNVTIAYFLFQHRNDASEPFRTCWRQHRFDGGNYYSVNFNNLGEFYPENNKAINLGRSSNKWSDVQTYKVNALEPSSLSLPSDRTARIDISSYFTNTGAEQSNSYTVPANGYIYLTLSELTSVHCFSRSSGNVTNYAQTFTKLSNSTGALYILFPVRKNDVFVATWYTTTTVSVDGAFFIPCKGNI